MILVTPLQEVALSLTQLCKMQSLNFTDVSWRFKPRHSYESGLTHVYRKQNQRCRRTTCIFFMLCPDSAFIYFFTTFNYQPFWINMV